MKKFRVILLFSFFLLIPLELRAEEMGNAPPVGMIDLNYYYDTREFTVLTINALAVLPRRFEYFSLVDYSGTDDSVKRLETTEFYTEQNLRWRLSEESPISLSSQWVGQSGERNDLLRLGVLVSFSAFSWAKSFLDGENNYVSVNLFPVQFEHAAGYHWQVEYFYRFQLFPRELGNRLYLSGFADQELDETFHSTWVTQHQLGYRAYGNFFVVTEFRVNEFRTANTTGWGFGAEYLISF